MSTYSQSITAALAQDKRKPARVMTPRDRNYLSGKAQGLFAGTRQSTIFYNPTDKQLDAIFDGTLWGHKQ